MHRLVDLSLAILAAVFLLGSGSIIAQAPPFTLLSPDFEANSPIPAHSSCDGRNDSPALHWTAPPTGTQSFALVLRDPDAPRGTFIHWVLWNIPASARSLPRQITPTAALPDGARQGMNSARTTGYTGPCPPHGPVHHYNFTLYALDTKVTLGATTTEQDLMRTLAGHIRATTTLTGLYQH